MTQIEERIGNYRGQLKDKEIIKGIHAGEIIKLSISDEKNNIKKLIYKECAPGRNNEIEIYNKLLFKIKAFVPVIKVWTTDPEAILMEDLGVPLKENFAGLPYNSKKSLLIKILLKLSDLHTNNTLNYTDLNLPKHKITTEWYDWCCKQFEKINSLPLDWVKSYWLGEVKRCYKFIESDYEIKTPLVLTHGDPHLDNIFQLNDSSIFFIDWEWTALASPLRDLTILLQDIYDIHLVNVVKQDYFKLLNEKGLNFDKRSYKEDFNYLYIDHTLMMLAWEIEKFLQGYITEKK